MTSWWVNEGGYPGILAGSNYGTGGNQTAAGAVQFRGPLDAARAAAGRIPQAEYPDGYLGNIIDRRQDRLLQSVSNRLSEQSYQRGVHKGSRISPKNYFWPQGEVQPDAGLERQAMGVRVGNVILTPKSAPIGNPVEMLAHQGRTSGMATPGMLGQKMQEARDYGVNPGFNPVVIQDQHLSTLRPKYRTAAGPRSQRDGTFESGK
jgi:hypothetical protein